VRALRVTAFVFLPLSFACGSPQSATTTTSSGDDAAPLQPALATDAVPTDPDDPAIWISPRDPTRFLILATDKIEASGGLYVFGPDGKLREAITPLDRPNNVDVEYGLRLGGTLTDIAVVTERMQHRLRVYGIPEDGGALIDLAPNGIPILAGQSGDASEPMGIALYRRPADGAIFVIVAPKTGEASDYLWQYRIEGDAAGGVQAAFVRRFGAFSGVRRVQDEDGEEELLGEIEAVAVDDALGYVYYSDERFGIRKYHADPDRPDAARELATFGTDGYLGDREGLAIFATGPRTGYIVSSDQLPGGSRLMLYPREGEPDDPDAHPGIATLPTVSDETDGLDVTAQPLPGFPRGLLVMMNSEAKTFLIYGWDAIEARLGPATR
jgi:3-phytase